MVLTVDTAYEGDDTFSLVESIRNTAEEYYPARGIWPVKACPPTI